MLETQFHGCSNSRQYVMQLWATYWVGWVGYPVVMGMVALQLLEQTKSAQSFPADVIVAFTMGPGLSLGTWLDRLPTLVNPHSSDFIMCHPSALRWNSQFFLHQYLYPWLETQRGLGDAYLRQFDGSRPIKE